MQRIQVKKQTFRENYQQTVQGQRRNGSVGMGP